MSAVSTDRTRESVLPEGRTVRRGSFRKLGVLLVPLLLLAGLVFAGVPTCPSKLLFGVPCPGCGLTRATIALASFDLAGAVAMHPLVFVLTPLFVWGIARTVLVSSGFLRGGSDLLSRVPTALWLTFLVVFVGVWALRLGGALGGHPDPVAPENGLLFAWLRLL